MSNEIQPLVIYVEDDEDDQELCNFALEDCEVDFELQYYTDGQEVIDHFDDLAKNISDAPRLPALILLDLSMPAINGWDVLAKIRSLDALRDIPVVVFTTSNSPRDKVKAYAEGANAYMVKPAGLKELSEMLQTTFKYWLDTVYITID